MYNEVFARKHLCLVLSWTSPNVKCYGRGQRTEMMANDAVVRRTKGIKRPQELQTSFIMALLRHLSSSLGPTNMKEDTSPKVCILYDNS